MSPITPRGECLLTRSVAIGDNRGMTNGERATYSAPKVTDLGTVESLTLGAATGNSLDGYMRLPSGEMVPMTSGVPDVLNLGNSFPL
jgi:hypothetical protein